MNANDKDDLANQRISHDRGCAWCGAYGMGEACSWSRAIRIGQEAMAEVERLRAGHGRQCSHDACDQEVAALRAEVERVTAASRAAQDDAYVCGRDEARAEVARLRDGILERYTEDGERIPGLTVIDGGYVSDLEAEVARLREAERDWDEGRQSLIAEVERRAVLWECPECAFGFDAIHENEDGGYDCPVCSELRLQAERDEALDAVRDATEKVAAAQREVSEARGALAEVARLRAAVAAVEALCRSAEATHDLPLYPHDVLAALAEHTGGAS